MDKQEHKHKWVGVYRDNNELLRIECHVPGCSEYRSLGVAARANPIEVRAAELAYGTYLSSRPEQRGYAANEADTVPRSKAEWAGWLKREILTAGRDMPVPAPSPDWQAGVLAQCDVIDEQRRHDVAASVARHADMDPMTCPVVPGDFNGPHGDLPVVTVDEQFDRTDVES